MLDLLFYISSVTLITFTFLQITYIIHNAGTIFFAISKNNSCVRILITNWAIILLVITHDDFRLREYCILDWENIAVPNRFYIEWFIMICRNFSLKMLFLNLILKLFSIFFVLIKQDNNKSKYFIATEIIYYGVKF